jgi:hypothetical protein
MPKTPMTRRMTEATAVGEMRDSADVEEILGDDAAAPRLAAILRAYELDKARIADPTPSADAAPASTDAGADRTKIYLRPLRPLSACAETRPPERHAASYAERPAAGAGILTRILRHLSPVSGDEETGLRV